MYKAWKGKADFYIVYIREAHPQGSRRPNQKVKIEQPKTADRRGDVAGKCVAYLKLSMPVLVDDMQDTVARAFHAMPDRLYILKADGTIGYRGGRGPRGFDVAEMEAHLKEICAAAAKEKKVVR